MKTTLSKIESKNQEFIVLVCGKFVLIKGKKVFNDQKKINQEVECIDNLGNHFYKVGEIYDFGNEQEVEIITKAA